MYPIVRNAFGCWNSLIKYAIIFSFAMAIAVVAITSNLLYFGYTKVSEHISWYLRRFFDRFVHEEITARFATLDDRFEMIRQEIAEMKNTILERDERQRTSMEELKGRVDLLRSAVHAEGHRVTIMTPSSMADGDDCDVMPSSSTSNTMQSPLGFNSSQESLQSTGSPQSSSRLIYPFSSNSGGSSPATSSPPPPPPPMPNFTFGMPVFKATPRSLKTESSLSTSANGKAKSTLVPSLAEISEARKKLKKIPETEPEATIESS